LLSLPFIPVQALLFAMETEWQEESILMVHCLVHVGRLATVCIALVFMKRLTTGRRKELWAAFCGVTMCVGAGGGI
jgi:hypothetical protein